MIEKLCNLTFAKVSMLLVNSINLKRGRSLETNLPLFASIIFYLKTLELKVDESLRVNHPKGKGLNYKELDLGALLSLISYR